MTKMEPEAFTLDRTDKLRDDIEARLTILDEKIEKKLDRVDFHWIIGIIVTIVIAVFGAYSVALYFLYENDSDIKQRITKIETIQNLGKKQH